MNNTRFLGVTVTPPYIQSEGVEAVLDGLAEAGVNAVATSPGVSEPIEELPGVDDAGSGTEEARREPPIDAGAGSVRVIERKLFGKAEVLLRFAPSYEPDLSIYEGLKYQPKMPDDLTAREGKIIRQFFDGAHARGMQVYFQVSAVQLYGLQDDDRPRLPNGQPPRSRMVNSAALASDEVRAFVCAQMKDLVGAYPDVDGFRHDWPEHPPYKLGDAFLDFGPHAERAAREMGFDFEKMRRSAGNLYERLHRLSNTDLERARDLQALAFHIARALAWDPGLTEALRFKAALTVRYVRELRDALHSRPAGRRMKLSPNAFPPPFSLLSGMDFGGVAELADSICMKLYTMHWPLIVYFYASELLEQNPGLDERLLARTLSRLFDIEDDELGESLSDYAYPPPERPHRAGRRAQARKIEEAMALCGDEADLLPIVHGYGPDDDFEARLRTVWDTPASGLWINRYCYLGPSKLERIESIAVD